MQQQLAEAAQAKAERRDQKAAQGQQAAAAQGAAAAQTQQSAEAAEKVVAQLRAEWVKKQAELESQVGGWVQDGMGSAMHEASAVLMMIKHSLQCACVQHLALCAE